MTADTAYKRALKVTGEALRQMELADNADAEQAWGYVAQTAASVAATLAPLRDRDRP